METCINHPLKQATARCKACHRPLCDECKIVTEDGVFCSDECHERQVQFTERAASLPKPKRSFLGGFAGFVKKLVILIILLLVAYGLITLIYGSTDAFFEQIGSLINTVF